MGLAGLMLLWSIAIQNPEAPHTAAIEGMTVLRGAGSPVSAASVELRPEGGAAKAYFAESDDNGRFSLAAVPPGRYRLFAMRDGYVPAEYGQRRPNTPGLVLELHEGERMRALDVPLTATGVIAGRILAPPGHTPGIALVEADRVSYEDGKRVLNVVQATRSDDEGNYRLFWLAPGRYYIGASLTNGLPATALTLDADGAAAGFAVSRATRRTVLNRPVSPITDTEIYAPIFFPGTPDESRAVPIDVAGGKEVSGIDIVAGPVPTYRVRGVVVDNETGDVVKNVQVRASTGGGSAGVLVDPATGAFSIGRLPSGSDYVLTASVGGKTGRMRILIDHTDFNIRIPLYPPFPITGRIIVDGQALSPEIAATLRVSLQAEPAAAGPQPGSAVAADGSFHLSVGPGDYWVNIAPILSRSGKPPGALPAVLKTVYVKTARLGAADALNDGLHFDGSPTDILEIGLSTHAASITGTVRDENGSAAVNVIAVLVPDAPLQGRPDMYKTTRTDSVGRFTLERVPAGKYRLFSWDDILDGAWRDPEVIRQYDQQGQAISLDDGMTPSIQLKMIHAALP